MKSLLLAVLPLCSALTGSHVQFSLGGSSYSHGAKVDHPAPTPVYTTPAPVYTKPVAVYHTPAPTYQEPAPVYQTQAPVYHTPAPVYQTQAPVYHKPALVYQTAPQYHAAPAYHTPKQNCSVVDEVVKAEVCTPALETKCSSVDLAVKVIVDKEQCQDITRTVCSAKDETIENKICVYTYEKESKDTTAKTVEVTYAKECKKQRVNVCQPAQGYNYHSYGQQYCKAEYQETCYNIPKVSPKDTDVSVVFPSPVKTCTDKSITIPRISCENITEEKCITVPETKEETEKVEKCEVTLAAPSCQYVDLTLPKQVCVGLVYGHATPITAQQYHAKV